MAETETRWSNKDKDKESEDQSVDFTENTKYNSEQVTEDQSMWVQH